MNLLSTPKLNKGLGRKKDLLDGRDLHVPNAVYMLQPGIGAPLPTTVDVFSGLNLPVYDQGALGSCTANSAVLYRRFLSQKFSKYSAPDTDLSRLFLYYQERKLPWNADTTTDSGASMRDACYVLAHTGAVPESADPYLPQDFSSPTINDSPNILSEAALFKVGAYHRIPDVSTAIQCLASGYAVLLGTTVYAELEDVGSDGMLKMPKAYENPIGGHALTIRGYDDYKGCFLVQNSWGPAWGDHGCFWIPYQYITETEISEPDMWMIHLGKPWV